MVFAVCAYACVPLYMSVSVTREYDSNRAVHATERGFHFILEFGVVEQ